MASVLDFSFLREALQVFDFLQCCLKDEDVKMDDS